MADNNRVLALDFLNTMQKVPNKYIDERIAAAQVYALLAIADELHDIAASLAAPLPAPTGDRIPLVWIDPPEPDGPESGPA